MSKFKELDARRVRLEKEVDKAQAELDKKTKLLKDKKNLLAQVNSEILSDLLITNGMSMSELTELLSNENGKKLSEDVAIPESIDSASHTEEMN